MIILAPSFQTQLSDILRADVRVHIDPMRQRFCAKAKWGGSDPWISTMEVDEYGVNDQIDLFNRLKDGLLRNRVRG